MIDKETLQRELRDLVGQKDAALAMVLRYDGAIQAVEALVALCDKKEDEQVNGELPSE